MNPSRIVMHNEKYSIRQGIAGSFPQILAWTYFPLFAISVLGASNYQVALLSSLPQIFAVLTVIPAAMLVNKAESKKKLTLMGLFLARFVLLLLAFVPLLPEEHAASVFVLLVGLMNIPYSLNLISWQAYIGDVVPARSRNLFFAKRNRYLTIASMIAMLVTGVLMFSQPIDNPVPYQLLFITCFAFGMFEVYFLNKQIEPQVHKGQAKRVSIFSRQLFAHKPYRVFLIGALLFNFAWQMSWPLFSIYNVDYCGANIFWMSAFGVANQLAQVLSYPVWAKLGKKYSNTKLLVFACFGMAVGPTLIVMSTNLVWVTLANAFMGVFVSGTVLLLFNGLLEASRDDMRTTFVANYNFLLGFVAFIAPQVGVLILELTSIEFAMHVSSVLRVICGIMFIAIGAYLKKSNENNNELARG